MAHRLKRKSEDWRRKLPRPILIKGGKTLRLLGDCRAYALALDRDIASAAPWQRAALLMIDAAGGGDLEAVCLQFERILFQQNKLVSRD
jgi:hypothetical protein